MNSDTASRNMIVGAIPGVVMGMIFTVLPYWFTFGDNIFGMIVMGGVGIVIGGCIGLLAKLVIASNLVAGAVAGIILGVIISPLWAFSNLHYGVDGYLKPDLLAIRILTFFPAGISAGITIGGVGGWVIAKFLAKTKILG